MASPIAGTLLRTVTTYPLPTYSPAELFDTGAPVVDATGDEIYFAAFFTSGAFVGNVAVFKYVYSTDTLTKFADLSLASSGNTVTSLLWNPARDTLLAYMVSGSDTQVWSVTVPGAVVTDLGVLSGYAFDMIVSDGTTYVGKNLSLKEFLTVDFDAMSYELLVTLPRYCQPIAMNDRYIFTTVAGSIQAPGPLVSLDREVGLLMKFLTGSETGAGSVGATNPKYMTCAFGLFSAYVVQNLVYMYSTVSDNPLVAYDLDTGITYRITDDFFCLAVYPGFVVSDDGSKLFSLVKYSGLFVYG